MASLAGLARHALWSSRRPGGVLNAAVREAYALCRNRAGHAQGLLRGRCSYAHVSGGPADRENVFIGCLVAQMQIEICGGCAKRICPETASTVVGLDPDVSGARGRVDMKFISGRADPDTYVTTGRPYYNVTIPPESREKIITAGFVSQMKTPVIHCGAE